MPTHSKLPSGYPSAIESNSAVIQSQLEAQPDAKGISRRQFARHAAAVVAAASLAPASVFALPPDTLPPPALMAKPQEGKSKLTPEQSAEVEGRLANIVRKYGDRLTEDQRQHLRRNLEYHQRLLAPVRTFPLNQGDSPAFTLRLVTGNDSEKGGVS
jgi:hypothetical protein